MTRNLKPPAILTITCTLLFAACPAGLADETVELGRRYVDPLHGFSLCPPLETERKREFSASQLVSWSRRHAQTGAIAWTLTVLQATEGNKQINLKPYSQALAAKLQQEENFKVASVQLAPVAGKAAIHLRGQTAVLQLWQRQVWVLAQPGRFLILRMTGPMTMKNSLDAICEQVLGTLQLTDPDRAREIQRENLARGQELLATLNDKSFAAAICGESQWFLLQFEGKDVGFRRVVETAVRREDADGYSIKTLVMLDLPKLEPRLLKQAMFVTPDLSVEQWTELLRIGPDENARVIEVEGLKQQEMIVCTISEGGRVQTHNRPVPEKIYLPQAAGVLLPRLIDLKKLTAYAFAIYNVEANAFDMRTFTVLGTVESDSTETDVSPSQLGAGPTLPAEAIRALDQPAADAEPATLWLDAAGRLLRMQTGDGLVMVRSNYHEVLRRLPRAAAIIKSTDD